MIQKSENLLNKKTIKITKQKHAFKGYASTDDVKILNSFNPELRLKDVEPVIQSKANR